MSLKIIMYVLIDQYSALIAFMCAKSDISWNQVNEGLVLLRFLILIK